MATFSVRFLGCKVSHTDVHDVRERLLGDGHDERPHQLGADVAVVNTCCVTHEAVRKSRQAATRAARTHRRVYITGCAANLASDAFARLPANVTVVARRSEETPEFVAGDVGALGCVQADARLDRVRAFVKIQDGCSFSCNFCVIPLVRGASRSRSADAILREVERRVAQGHREIVLTGINLGCYRDRTAGYKLPRLVREVGAVPGLARLRLSSIEVNHVDDELVAALRDTPTVSRHLHVPLQSGDDGVLEDMARRYTLDDVPAPPRAAQRLQPDDGRDRRLPHRDGAGVSSERSTSSRAAGVDEDPRLPVLAASRDADCRLRPRAASGEEGTECTATGRVRCRVSRALADEGRRRRRRPRRQTRAAGTATTTRRGSSTRLSASSSHVRGAAVSEEGILAA